MRRRLFTRSDELPEGVTRLPIKTIHVNKSPVVIGKLKTLAPATAERWGLDVAAALRHAAHAQALGRTLDGLWPQVYARPAAAAMPDVDEDLYGGFVPNETAARCSACAGWTRPGWPTSDRRSTTRGWRSCCSATARATSPTR